MDQPLDQLIRDSSLYGCLDREHGPSCLEFEATMPGREQLALLITFHNLIVFCQWCVVYCLLPVVYCVLSIVYFCYLIVVP